MSTLSTNNIVQYCLNTNFQKHCIGHIKYIKKIPLKEHEILLDIDQDRVHIIDQHTKQDPLRLQFVSYLLSKTIPTLNLKCKIILNTGDGCNKQEQYTRLCFSCSFDSNHIQIPDPHIFQYFNFQDNIPFDQKQDRIIFVGSDTGTLDNELLNERIRFCSLAQTSNHIYAKISNFVHFNKEMLQHLNIKINEISSNYISKEEQLKYKFILNISGNTASWDRTPWGMKSNSYLINLESACKEYNWYYPIIESEGAIDTISVRDVLDKKYCYNERKKQNQQKIANSILKEHTHLDYFKQTLSLYNEIYNS